MKKVVFHIGCSAFNNSYWKEIFYPETLPSSKWFAYYCEHFTTYEINGSFYRPPTIESLSAWYAKTPDGFQFSVKAPKKITHLKKFIDCNEIVDDFYSICKNGLKEKLACILFQLPPSFDYSPEKLIRILSCLNPDFKNVIEFRNVSWWIPEVYKILSEHHVTFCCPSYPKLPEELVKTNTVGYIRLHGRPKLFYSEYTDVELQHIYKEALQKGWEEVYLYFNNTASAAGIKNAMVMMEL